MIRVKVASKLTPANVRLTYFADPDCPQCLGSGQVTFGWRGRLFKKACSCARVVRKENASRFDVTV